MTTRTNRRATPRIRDRDVARRSRLRQKDLDHVGRMTPEWQRHRCQLCLLRRPKMIFDRDMMGMQILRVVPR